MVREFRDLIFKNSFNTLTELKLIVNEGIILDKQLCPNTHLKQLTISLQNVDDLYVLLDGLVPNLIYLNVTICQSNVYKRSSLPESWPHQYMSHLIEFQLETKQMVTLTFEQLRGIVMPLMQLNKFTLNIEQWISNDQRFVHGHEFEILIDQFMPQLHHFYCSIKTMNDIDMQTFAKLSERWPMKFHVEPNSLRKHLYTFPWSFEHLYTSMLATDDTTSVCPNVRYLTIDAPCTKLSHRFPNAHTLTIIHECNIFQDNYIGFRRLRHLTMRNITIVPSSLIQKTHTITLFETSGLLNNPIVYSNIQHLILKCCEIDSSATAITLVKHFPNLQWLEIGLQSNAEYYDSLDILLSGEYLPYLLLLRTNWMNSEPYCSDINLWITAKTSLKWSETPFYGYRHRNDLIICL